jgi:hypothetical protein
VPALEKLWNERRASPEELERAIASIGEANAWSRSAHRLSNLAAFEYELAVGSRGTQSNRRVLLNEAKVHIDAALSLNPADGEAWLRRGVVLEAINAPGYVIAQSLVMSMDHAPNARYLWLKRASLLLAYWPYLRAEELEIAKRQILTIWQADGRARAELVRLSELLGRGAFLEWALSPDPKRLQELHALYSALDRK